MTPLTPSYVLVRDPNALGDSEPIIQQYLKTSLIQPVQIMGSSEGITGFDSVVKSSIGTSAVAIVDSSVGVKKATLRVRSLGTGSYLAVGGSARQEVRLLHGQSVDLWCSNLDHVHVRVDTGATGVVEVLYGY